MRSYNLLPWCEDEKRKNVWNFDWRNVTNSLLASYLSSSRKFMFAHLTSLSLRLQIVCATASTTFLPHQFLRQPYTCWMMVHIELIQKPRFNEPKQSQSIIEQVTLMYVPRDSGSLTGNTICKIPNTVR